MLGTLIQLFDYAMSLPLTRNKSAVPHLSTNRREGGRPESPQLRFHSPGSATRYFHQGWCCSCGPPEREGWLEAHPRVPLRSAFWRPRYTLVMRNEFTAVIERDGEWFV